MDKTTPLQRVLGLDIGRINTRAMLFGIYQEKYRLLGSQSASTSLGNEQSLAHDVTRAIDLLQEQTGVMISRSGASQVLAHDPLGRGADRLALVASVGDSIPTVLLGLAPAGSLKAGRALVDSLPLKLKGVFDIGNLLDEPGVIRDILLSRPEILILTGGEDAGAETSIMRWIEALRTVCLQFPEPVKPLILYAGNPLIQSAVKRSLEPLAKLLVAPNIQPEHGTYDLVPAAVYLDREIIKKWGNANPGLADLTDHSANHTGTVTFAQDRMMRYLSRAKQTADNDGRKEGLLAVNLGGAHTRISAGMRGLAGTVELPVWQGLPGHDAVSACQAIHKWSVEPVSFQEAEVYYQQQALFPGLIPDTQKELALSLAYARHRLQRGLARLSRNYDWFAYDQDAGLSGHYEPIIASGAILTRAPTPGHVMAVLLDGIQPRGITTIVLDRYQVLPLLGKVAEAESLLPVHLLESDAFVNLGTVVTAVSDLPSDRLVLTVDVQLDSGQSYTVEIGQGYLRRLDIPVGVSAVLNLQPHHRTDVGFGGAGIGGRLKVIGGQLGVVIDARGRPLRLPTDSTTRTATIQRWLWALGV